MGTFLRIIPLYIKQGNNPQKCSHSALMLCSFILVVKKRHSLTSTQAAHKYSHLGLFCPGVEKIFLCLLSNPPLRCLHLWMPLETFFSVQHIHQKVFFHIIFTLSTIVHVSEMPLVENGIRDVLLNKSKVINLTGAFRPAQHRHTPSNIWCWHCLKGILSLTFFCSITFCCFNNNSECIFCILVSARKQSFGQRFVVP